MRRNSTGCEFQEFHNRSRWNKRRFSLHQISDKMKQHDSRLSDTMIKTQYNCRDREEWITLDKFLEKGTKSRQLQWFPQETRKCEVNNVERFNNNHNNIAPYAMRGNNDVKNSVASLPDSPLTSRCQFLDDNSLRSSMSQCQTQECASIDQYSPIQEDLKRKEGVPDIWRRASISFRVQSSYIGSRKIHQRGHANKCDSAELSEIEASYNTQGKIDGSDWQDNSSIESIDKMESLLYLDQGQDMRLIL